VSGTSEHHSTIPEQRDGIKNHFWRTNSHIRSITDAEGALIMDIRTGRFHSFNTAGAVVWKTLRQNPGGVDSTEIRHAMTTVFGPHPRMASDLDKLLRTFEQKGFVQRQSEDNRNSHRSARASSKVRRQLVTRKDVSVSAGWVDLPSVTELTKHKSGGFWTCAAWLGFMGISLILWIGGFARLHRTLQWISAKPRIGEMSKAKIATVCVAVNKAATYYLRKSWCLHRAAVTFSLLRLAGMPAELVIGCQRVPFYSHAWVEIYQTVINDDPSVKALYLELDRV